MPDHAAHPTTTLFWTAAVVLFLWGLGGSSIFVAYFVETPEQFASTAETEENREAYAEYIANIPAWAMFVGITAALTRLLGGIGLLLRRRWSLELYVISLVLFVASLVRGFLVAGAARVMSPGHIAIEMVFLALGIFAVGVSHRFRKLGVLR